MSEDYILETSPYLSYLRLLMTMTKLKIRCTGGPGEVISYALKWRAR